MRHLIFPINALPSCQMIDGGIDDILWNADLKFKALKQYYEKIDSDLLFYLGDIVIQAEAMGATIKYSKEVMPSVQSLPQVFCVPNPNDVTRMKVNAKVLKKMEKEFPDKLRAAQLYGPFTVAGQVAGEENILKGIEKNKKEVLDLLKKTFECAKIYALYLMEAGANSLWISDPLAALIPPDQFWDFAGDFLKKIFDLFTSIPTILHICGDTCRIVMEIVKTGAQGISFDNCMDLLAVENEVPEDVYIIGNIDPVDIIELGSADDVISQTSDLVFMMGMKDNFVLSTGCAVPPSAPIENIKLFVETGRNSMFRLESHIPLLPEISKNVFEGERKATQNLVAEGVEAGIDPLTIVIGGLTRAIRKGSALYEVKKCFLPSILLMVDAFYDGFNIVEHRLKKNEANKHTILIGTVKGDIHEIGKNLVKIFLDINGYNVVDLGVDVHEDAFINAYHKFRPSIIGLSAFTTDSRKEMARVINSFYKEGIEESLFIVGGAAVNSETSRSIGADGYARDAVRAVNLVGKLLKQSRGNIS